MDTSERPRIGRSANPVIGAGRQTLRAYGQATARFRPDPDFLIIGAKRGGSTSFYYDLLGHPAVIPLFPNPRFLPKAEATKGIHYFDQNYFRGERWYRSHLPTTWVRARGSRRAGEPVVVGEASPYYLFHPVAAERAAATVPNAKIIAVLRDPVVRAHSHWKERRRSGGETLGFAAALAAEDERVGNAESQLVVDVHAYSYAHEQLTYARQSEYVVGLQRWYDHFPAAQILILASEDYYRDAKGELAKAQSFLGLRAVDLASGPVRNAADGEQVDAALRSKLSDHFAPYNSRLTDLTGRSFPW